MLFTRMEAKEVSGHKEDAYAGYGKQKQQTLYSPEAEYVAEDRYASQKERQDYVAMPPSKWDHPGY
jgi:hypothetical protein